MSDMRAEFQAWVQDCGCDTDGAWSAWQGCWNRRAALTDADRELMEQEIAALEKLTETIEMGDPHWADAKCFKAAVAAIAALRTRLLRHSEGKE